MNKNLNNSIEQALLSTIFFSQNLEDFISLLEPKDFYYPNHQKIFAAMVKLHNQELPIDETFILKIDSEITEQDLIGILSVNAITNPIAYAKEIKEASKKRELDQLLKVTKSKVEEGETNSFEILELLKKSIDNYENNQHFDDLFKIVDFNSIKETEPTFYLENILPIQEKEINIISAKGGSGKSYASAYLMLELANKHNLKCFAWFSEDAVGITKKRINGLSKLHELPIKNITIIGKEERAFQFVKADFKTLSVNSLFSMMKKQLKNYDVIFLDPLIAFFGGDENSNADARYFMNLLNEWCEQDNKTIILIHHHSKGESGTARGAGAFIDACRIHYTLEYKYSDKEKKNIDSRYRVAKIEKTNHFSGKREYEIRLFNESKHIEVQEENNVFEKFSKKVYKQKGIQENLDDEF